jgi:fructose-bisphosphate aldolase class I
VPPAVPGVVFLSGGQSSVLAARHLNAINQLDMPKPWRLSFSFGRALQGEALEAWNGKSENVAAGQRAFFHRARCVSAATLGRYSPNMESEAAFVQPTMPPQAAAP